MKRAFFAALGALCLCASTAVEAQRHSAPAYRPPPPPRYTPPPPANQNMRPGGQTGGGMYQGSQPRGGVAGGNLGGYRPGTISNSNSQGSGRLIGAAPAAGGSSGRIVGPSTQSGVGTGTKSAGIGTAKQAGAAAFGQGSALAKDKGKTVAKAGPKVAAASAGAAAFAAGAKPAATKSSVDDPYRPDVKGKAKSDFNNASGNRKKIGDKEKDTQGPNCPPGQIWDRQQKRCVPKPPTLAPRMP